ncbi:hypothetical protein [Streptomyces pini]|uniref:Uncharacterized protein n=1 Tax=Streptomyces pini TaxID=1520580 RepID=A0A1I4FEX4_9ACTN|nr:hypothetical protein [Streptomyces pini]SFL16478.1 hypothetical protein SAMN05192584_11415 [Streptomyces pini]
MADRLEDHLADLAESGRRYVAPLAAERIRARGERRLRRRRAAAVSGGALLSAALVLGGLSLASAPREPAEPAGPPTPTASPFVPPTPAPGEEYAGELGYVYGAVAEGDGTVRVTVERLRATRGTVAPTGVVHTLVLPGRTPVEARRLTGGEPADVELDRLVEPLADGPRWVFVIDYDSAGRVQSLREAFWLDG